MLHDSKYTAVDNAPMPMISCLDMACSTQGTMHADRCPTNQTMFRVGHIQQHAIGTSRQEHRHQRHQHQPRRRPPQQRQPCDKTTTTTTIPPTTTPTTITVQQQHQHYQPHQCHQHHRQQPHAMFARVEEWPCKSRGFPNRESHRLPLRCGKGVATTTTTPPTTTTQPTPPTAPMPPTSPTTPRTTPT